MGSGDADLPEYGDGGGEIATAEAVGVSCSICLEAVTANGDRSRANLQCGHQFHLDCIGSAFNVKGSMQCPNCRKIEKGQWLFANGSRPAVPEFSMDEWVHDEDLYDLNYSEMSFLHWCPFSGLARLPATFEEAEFPSTAYHDLLGHHAILAEHTLVSSTSHPCPYFAYYDVHPSSSTSSGTVSDVSTFNNHWSGPSEVPNAYAFPSMDVHYQNWDHSPFATNSHIGGSDQSSVPPAASQRTARNTSDMPRPGMHPYIFGHSSGSRAPSSVTSAVLPHYPGTVGRARDRVPSLQAYFQQSTSSPVPLIASGGRRSGSHRGLAQVAAITPSSDQSNNGFYFVSSNSSGRSFQEVENPIRDRWEQHQHQHHHHHHHQQQPPFPLSQVDRDSIWGPIQPQSGGYETNGIRPSSSFRPRHGTTERMPSQNR